MSGAIFLILGAIVSNPLVLFLGQVQVAVLAVAFMLLVPAAISLDRRRVRFEILDEEEDDMEAHMVGTCVPTRVRIVNGSSTSLYALVATPFGAEQLEMTEIDDVQLLPGASSLVREFTACAARCGRWVMHGFDVRITDPLGLIETRDYLPCQYAMEFYPKLAPPRRRRRGATNALARREGGRHTVQRLGLGTDIRELREHQPGDPLRHIAWKATVRRGKLISKNFEHETARSVYALLDISSSMRGGQRPGEKLERGIQLVASIADTTIRNRDAMGLMSFDEKLYGHVPSGSAPHHLRRILHHLVGLNSVVDSELTEFDDHEVEALLADYLLIQERLDFKKGEEVSEASGVNSKLLRRWLTSVLPANAERWRTPALGEGLLERKTSRLRHFAQLRGVQVPYRVEARLGMKERGLVEALEHLMAHTRGRHALIVISDLCGIMNLELLARGVRLVQTRGSILRFVVPFTPAFYDDGLSSGGYDRKYKVLKEMFTHSERQERTRIVDALRALGVHVEFAGPGS
ncbi:MAG: DUF58 domain-containing protein [Myxococcota bacterium]